MLVGLNFKLQGIFQILPGNFSVVLSTESLFVLSPFLSALPPTCLPTILATALFAATRIEKDKSQSTELRVNGLCFSSHNISMSAWSHISVFFFVSEHLQSTVLLILKYNGP